MYLYNSITKLYLLSEYKSIKHNKFSTKQINLELKI
jgi:hypothetical protein